MQVHGIYVAAGKKEGDTSNNSELCLPAHLGLIFAPLHFDPNGKALDEYSPEFFIFKK